MTRLMVTYTERNVAIAKKKKKYRPNLGSRITQKVSLVVLIDFFIKH